MEIMDAASALKYLNRWGFVGVRSGRMEFFKGQNSKKITMECGNRVEPLTERQFLVNYRNRNFKAIGTEDMG